LAKILIKISIFNPENLKLGQHGANGAIGHNVGKIAV